MSTPNGNGWVGPVIASSFADPEDLRRYREAIASGMTESRALKIGDNGIGFLGDFTAQDEEPMCALPFEVWHGKWGSRTEAKGRRVEVYYNHVSVFGILGDTMPHLAQITNGAGIDLNPAFLKFLGLQAPLLIGDVYWRWLE